VFQLRKHVVVLVVCDDGVPAVAEGVFADVCL